MKTFQLLLLLIMFASGSKAQIAKWLTPQNYEKMAFAQGSDIIIADSANVNVLFDKNGNRLAGTKDRLLPFNEGFFVIAKKNENKVIGFYDLSGKFTKIPELDFAATTPLFHDGYLLLSKDNSLVFFDTSGKQKDGLFITALPFCNGFTTCSLYKNAEKSKDPYNVLIDTKWNSVKFRYKDKDFDNDDIEYISSVNDEGIAFIVAKHKVYIFHADDKSLTPLLYDKADITLKSQARIKDDISVCMKEKDNVYILDAQCGKKDMMSVAFDNMKRPLCVKRGNTVSEEYKKNQPEEPARSSVLTNVLENGLYGISQDGEMMLAPQFEDIPFCFDNKAIVTVNGKQGLLEVDKDAHFQIRLNKGKDLPFLHQTLETTVRLEMPNVIKADKTYLETSAESECIIDKLSREIKNTDSGNYVEYTCELKIPSNLTNALTDIEYPFFVQYNGLKSPVINHKQKAWYFMKYDIEEDETKQSVSNGTLTFVFTIRVVDNTPTEVAHFDVNVLADGLQVEREDQMSEMRYKYKVYNLDEGVNNISVQILEQGCPPAIFPYEVEYHKSVARRGKTNEKTEQFSIKKKHRNDTTPEPHLKI